MALNYNSHVELLDLIKGINFTYYDRFNANILFIEEFYDRIFPVYIIELRDAYSHLVRVFDYDTLSVKGKENALYHLDHYVSHLQRGLLDTFRKILALELKATLRIVHKNDVKVVQYQIAKEAHELRIMGKGITEDARIEGYIKLLNYMSDIRKKYPARH
jgi:hypothetical protein